MFSELSFRLLSGLVIGLFLGLFLGLFRVMGYVLHCLLEFCAKNHIFQNIMGKCSDGFYGW